MFETTKPGNTETTEEHGGHGGNPIGMVVLLVEATNPAQQPFRVTSVLSVVSVFQP